MTPRRNRRSVIEPTASSNAAKHPHLPRSARSTVADHLTDECHASVDGGHPSSGLTAELTSYGSRRAFGAPGRAHAASGRSPAGPALGVLHHSQRQCLRRGPHESGMMGRNRPAIWVVGRGESPRLPLSPVRTYQEPPEGPRSFVQWGASTARRTPLGIGSRQRSRDSSLRQLPEKFGTYSGRMAVDHR